MSRFIELHLNEKDSPLVIVTQIELFIYVGLTAFVEGDSLYFNAFLPAHSACLPPLCTGT